MKKSKFLAAFLVFVMLLTLIPATALAEETAGNEPETEQTAPVEETEAAVPPETPEEAEGQDDGTVPDAPADAEEPVEPTEAELLQARIDALPEAEAVEALMESDPDAVDAVYAEVCALTEAVEALDGELDTAKLDALVELFTPEAAVLAASADCPDGDACQQHEAAIGGTHYDTLAEALAAGEGQTVKLLKDVSMASAIAVKKEITLDLAGKNITFGDYGFLVYSDGNLNLTGTGKITANYYALWMKGAASDDGTKCAATVGEGVTLSAPGAYTVAIWQNGDASYGVDLTVNGTLSEGAAGIFVLGNIHQTTGAIPKITLNKTAKVEGTGVGVAINGYADVTVDGATVTGTSEKNGTGIEIRAGKLTVNSGTISGNGSPTTVGPNGSGTTSLGCGIAVSQHTTKLPIDVTISGGEIKGASALYESTPQDNPNIDVITLAVSGGDFQATNNGTVSVYSQNFTAEKDKGFITGGTFTDKDGVQSDVSAYFPADAALTQDENGTVILDTNVATVAEVNGVPYQTLQAAINKAEDGDTVTLTDDVKLSTGVDIDKKLTLDLKGHTITDENWTGNDYLLAVKYGSDLTIDGNGAVTTTNPKIYTAVKMTLANDTETSSAKLTVKSGTLQGYYYGIAGNGTRHNTDITIDGGTIKGTNGAGIYHPQDGKLTINGGEVTGLNTAVELRSGTLEVNNGKLTATAATYNEEQNSNGTSVSGAALAISQHTTKKPISVTINGGEFHGVYALSETNVQNPDDTKDVEIVKITDGTFVGSVKSADCEGFVKGGNYSESVDSKYLDSSLTAELKDASNTEAPYSYYKSVEEAQKVASAGDTINDLSKTQDADKIYFTVTLDYNDGKSANVVYTVESSDTYTVPANPTRSGYTFRYWKDASGKTYKASDDITVTGDVVLTAKWERKSSGGSGSGSSSYSVTVEKSKHGDVTVSPRNASKGDTVTITVKPDKGYELDELTVTDKYGDSVKLKKKSDTKYTFTMPAGKVEVEAVFTKIEEQVKPNFIDVPDGYWAEDAIDWAFEKGYMNGTSADTFNPGGDVSRQQLWMILARLSGQRPADMAEARSWAVDNGVSDGTFPGRAVSRQQLVTILYRYAARMGYKTSGAADLTRFPDHASVAAYARDAMSWSVANDIVGGTAAGTLNPTGTATRAQFAVILSRFCENIVD